MRPIVLDISFYQDNPDTKDIIVDFYKMKSSGVSGVIFRVGQGSWEDTKFGEYWKNSNEIGLARGAYWYYDNRYSPKEQAIKCLLTLEKYDVELDMPLFADFEDRRSGSYGKWNDWYNFLEELNARSNSKIKLGIYSNYYYWMEFKPKEISAEKYFSTYPLWIAQYPYDTHMEESLYKQPSFPTTWKTWDLWQVSDRGDGRKFGVESSRVDVNYFNGTQHDFELKYNINQSFNKPPIQNIVIKEPEIFSIGFYAHYKNKEIKLKTEEA